MLGLLLAGCYCSHSLDPQDAAPPDAAPPDAAPSASPVRLCDAAVLGPVIEVYVQRDGADPIGPALYHRAPALLALPEDQGYLVAWPVIAEPPGGAIDVALLPADGAAAGPVRRLVRSSEPDERPIWTEMIAVDGQPHIYWLDNGAHLRGLTLDSMGSPVGEPHLVTDQTDDVVLHLALVEDPSGPYAYYFGPDGFPRLLRLGTSDAPTPFFAAGWRHAAWVTPGRGRAHVTWSEADGRVYWAPAGWDTGTPLREPVLVDGSGDRTRIGPALVVDDDDQPWVEIWRNGPGSHLRTVDPSDGRRIAVAETTSRGSLWRVVADGLAAVSLEGPSVDAWDASRLVYRKIDVESERVVRELEITEDPCGIEAAELDVSDDAFAVAWVDNCDVERRVLARVGACP